MIDRAHRLSISGQAQLLGLSRGSVYYQRRPSAAADVALMRQLDALHVEYPFAGSRRLRDLLRQEGHEVGRLHVATLMKRMGIAALYRRPATSHPTPGHPIYPYLLRKLAGTYVPMARGFVYLVAVVDWFSRKVLAWRLSITLETEPCLEALSEALAWYGPPEILNTDQGSQFTAVAVLTALQDAKIAISMDGKGAWRDNVFVERGCGGRSQTRKSPCAPTVASRRRVAGWTAMWHSTTGADHIPHLAGNRPIRPMSTSQRQARRRHNQRGDPLIDRSQPVQNR